MQIIFKCFGRCLGAIVLVALIPACLSSLTGNTVSAQERAGVIQVCATVPDLGDLTREVGGGEVSVTVFTKGPEDPHFLEAKPGFIKALNQADLLVSIGMDLEAGWLPTLLNNARNGKVLPGARGYLDASTVITPLDVPTGPVDRSMGDVHPTGNPHYLLDPVNGLKVARLIRDRLSELKPQRAPLFNENYDRFRRKVGAALVGEQLAVRYDPEKLAILFKHGKLAGFLKEQGEETLLGGWLGRMLPHIGAKAVGDHNQWPYFSDRFGIVMVGFLEPKPGVSPTTKHLGEIIAMMRKEAVRIILKSSYFDPRPARFVSDKTGARIVELAHQTGAIDGAEGYIGMIDFNVSRVIEALNRAA